MYVDECPWAVYNPHVDELREFRDLLRSRLRERGDLARLSAASGIASHVLGRWRDGHGRPTDVNLKRLAPALGVPYEELMRMCSYLSADHNAAKSQAEERISQQQTAARTQRLRWVEVLGPRMGTAAAEDYYWETVRQLADTTLSVIEKTWTAVSDPTDTAISAPVSDHPKRSRRKPNTGKGPLSRYQHTGSDLLARRFTVADDRRPVVSDRRAA